MTTVKIKNFTDREMSCGCDDLICPAPPVDPDAMLALQGVRDEVRFPMPVTSSVRCPAWNSAVGGSTNSMHLRGVAFDIAIIDQEHGDKIETAARKRGFNGIGRYDSFIHIDRRVGKKAFWDERTG